MVHWDNGKQSNYRVGHLNAYDLRMFDNGPCGVKHTFHVCNYCKDSDSGNSDRKECVAGIMWACASCEREGRLVLTERQLDQAR